MMWRPTTITVVLNGHDGGEAVKVRYRHIAWKALWNTRDSDSNAEPE